MTREEKNQEIDTLTEALDGTDILYLADVAGLNAEQTSSLRRMCFQKEVKLNVVKNTLLRKAMEKSEKNFDELFSTLEGNTSIMISEKGNAPAKLIKEFRKKQEKPILKAACIEDAVYIGDEHLNDLSELKSKEELVGDVVALLQAPAQNVVSALTNGSGDTIGNLVKALEERGE